MPQASPISAFTITEAAGESPHLPGFCFYSYRNAGDPNSGPRAYTLSILSVEAPPPPPATKLAFHPKSDGRPWEGVAGGDLNVISNLKDLSKYLPGREVRMDVETNDL